MSALYSVGICSVKYFLSSHNQIAQGIIEGNSKRAVKVALRVETTVSKDVLSVPHLAASPALRHKLKECVKLVIQSQIGKGISTIREQGFKGVLLKPEFWTEPASSPRYGPEIAKKLLTAWHRSRTTLSYHSWLTTKEGMTAIKGVLETFRARPEARSEELELHPVSNRMVHKVAVSKICVVYLNQSERTKYVVRFKQDPHGKSYMEDIEGNRLKGSFAFVIGPDKTIYAARHQPNHFHHSSFLQGAAVISAGKLTCDESGFLKNFNNDSGHYKPDETNHSDAVCVFKEQGIDFTHVNNIYIDWNKCNQ